MKILILQEDFPPYAKGGAGAVVASYARELVKEGHEVCVLTAVQDKKAAGVLLEEGIKVVRFYSDYHARWRAWRCLYNPPALSPVKKILKEFCPDVVHAHNVHQNISYYSLVLAKRGGVKVFLTAHDVQSFHYGKLFDYVGYRVSARRQLKEQRLRYNPFRNIVIRHIFKRYVNRIIAVSYALKDALEANGIHNVEVIHNGIDVVAWQEPAEHMAAFKKQHGVGEHAILFSGGLTEFKGSRQITEALGLVVKQIPDAQLLVVGRGPVSVPHVVSTGWLQGRELRCAYHAAAVVVVPSICFDSFPTINLEAMACAKPLVATVFGGSREAVVEGETGYVVNPFDTNLLSQKIIELLTNPNKAKDFGEAARRRVEEEFTLEKQVRTYLELFARITPA